MDNIENKKNIQNILIYSTSWCSDCYRSKTFLNDKKIEYTEVDIEKNPEEVEKVLQLNNGMQTVPTIVITYTDNTNTILREPSNDELSQALGLV